MNEIGVTDALREEVYSILKEALGRDATGIYIPVESDYDVAYSNLLYDEDFTPFAFNDEIEENNDITIKYGASRFVIIPYGKPYVIKMPITAIYGERVYLERLNEKGEIEQETCWAHQRYYDEYENYDEVERKFECDAQTTGYDLMNVENEICASVEDCGEIAGIFLPNEWIGEYNGIPVYIQRQVAGSESEIGDYHSFIDAEDDEKEKVYTSRDQTDIRFNNDFVLAILRTYGAAALETFSNMINAVHLEDMHEGNYGYLKDGTPVIFDYGGFDYDCLFTTN